MKQLRILFVVICVACASAATRRGDAPVDYYNEGVANMKNELWPEAIAAFNTLKQKFPYSKYAALGELRLADIKFNSDRFLEAIEAYRLFVQYHPNHEEVAYALYREALSHYKEVPDDWFFMPPSWEKDQAEIERAARGFREYMERLPNGANAADAKKKLVECNVRLAQHDLFVARFYAKREKYRGAAARYETARALVMDTPLELQVLLELGQTYVKLGDKDKVRTVFGELIERHPKAAEATTARAALQQLK